MTKKFKVTCFSTKSFATVHKYWVEFVWDALNHRWVEKRSDPFGNEAEYPYYGDPEETVKIFLSRMNGNIPHLFWSVKRVG